jgi:molybdopterin converting factor small subunit
MRMTLEKLCQIDATELKNLPHQTASQKIIDACIAEKQKLSIELRDTNFNQVNDYEHLSQLNYKIMKLDQAIEERQQDLDEVMA